MICKRQVSVFLAKLDMLAIQQSNHSDRLRIRDADVVEGPVVQRDKLYVFVCRYTHEYMYIYIYIYIVTYIYNNYNKYIII